MIVDAGGVRLERYWKLSYAVKRTISEAEAIEELLARLQEAVRLRLTSDVPLGAFLSGGVDSGMIVAMMARLGSAPVKTFSIGFEEEEFNELPQARLVAERYATEHHEFIVRPDAVEVVPELVWHYGEPFADSSAVPTYYLSELARRHVTVALNGDAGDENFAGYARYRLPPSARLFDRLPGAVRRSARAAIERMPEPRPSSSVWSRAMRRARNVVATPGGRYHRRMMMLRPELKSSLCTASFLEAAEESGAAFLADAYERSDALDATDAKLDVDVQYYLPDCLLVKVDIATMAHGLEARSPMLDHEFMEFAASLPSRLKLRDGCSKYILKQAARRLLPAANIDRPKRGFGLPLERWFRGRLGQFAADMLLDGRLAARGYFHPAVVEQLVREHRTGLGRWHNELWTLVMLESWHRMFIDQRPGAAPPRRVPTVIEAR